jgi:hypothetical protein
VTLDKESIVTLVGTGPQIVIPQEPYGEVAASIPGKIELEHFDKGGSRKAYSDEESENKGDADFRTDEGVDLVKAGDGIGVGHTIAGEWLEYTVNVSSTEKKIFIARVASGSTTSSFQLFLDDVAITDTIKVPQTAEDNWDTYAQIQGDLKSLTAGEHVLKVLITGSYVNLDWIALGEDVPEELPTAIGASPLYNVSGAMQYRVYDLQGTYMGTLSASDFASLNSGAYIVRSTDGRVSKLIGIKK